jgi:hypothetical protein
LYYYLVHSLKRRLILELKDSFGRHPIYRKITPFIQNRFSFTERPQFGIVVKGSSANKVALSADNYVGVIQSHVMLAYVGQPAYPLEWVREDLKTVQKMGGMPTAPGVYYIEILKAPTDAGEQGVFIVDPLLTVTDEPVLMFQTGIEREAQLQQVPVRHTLRLYENRNYLLRENTDYTVDYETGAIQLLTSFGAGSTLSADYRYAGTSIGPVPFSWNTPNTTTLPGVVLAFGKRAEDGQKVAVVVYQDRVDAAKAFGGKFEVSFDLDVISRDTVQMEEIADLTMMYLWAHKKERLEFEGIEIMDVSMGGEAEEIADETGEEFFYQASLSVQLRADWEAHVPLPLTISKVTQTTREGDTDPRAPSGIQAVVSDLFFETHPILQGRNDSYERIG